MITPNTTDPYVIIEGYSDEDTPRRATYCRTIPAMAHEMNNIRREIMEDYTLTVNEPTQFGWMEGKRQRYCAARRNPNFKQP